MPVPWEALIPFGQAVSMSALSGLLLTSLGLVTAMFGAAGTLLNVSKRAQNQGKVRQANLVIARIYSFTLCLIPASEIPYRLLGGNVDGQRPATHRTCTETDGAYLTFLFISYAIDSSFATV